ncbi:MAG: hypothetical protein MMC33_001975 [Icmadophila ericetorum]|nr:hypothetical protein [Icmadophila ericetorum]
MFDIIPNLISSIITVLFPIFASYKALRTSDPAQLTPWLMYWVVFSCFTLAESWTWIILSIVPFYAYLRLFLLSYLVLPQTQGARIIYQSHIHPFLAEYEAEIDKFIGDAHDRAKSAGIEYLKRAIEFIKVNVFGLQPKAESRPQTPNYGGSYAQTLLSRFNLPSAREGLAAPAGDFYGLLSTAFGQVGSRGTNPEAKIEEMSASGLLVPQGITGTANKISFLETQKERLRVLLSALEKESQTLETEEQIERDVHNRLGEGSSRGSMAMHKSRSETEFDTIDKDEASGQTGAPTTPGGSWLPWAWGSKPESKGRSTGTDFTS